MYDFDSPNITQLSEGRVEKRLLLQYLKKGYPHRKDWIKRKNLDIDSYEEARKEYKAWVKHRARELDEQYEANRRQIQSGKKSIEDVQGS